MKSLREKKQWIKDYDTAQALVEDLEVIYEFFKEEEATAEDVTNRYELAEDAIKNTGCRRRTGVQKYAF